MPKKNTATAVETALVIPEAVQEELTLLRGFRDLVAERVGYALGVSAVNAEMKEDAKVAEKRKEVNALAKEFKGNLENYVKNGDFETFSQMQSKIKEARKAKNEAEKPYRQKISPLRKAIKYIDNIAIPDSLKELGVTVQPAFSLSEWVKKAVEKSKKR